MNTAIRLEHVTKQYGRQVVLDDISFNLYEGEFVCLLGPSGCGKSTLLRLIAGLDEPTSGNIYLNEKDVTNVPSSKRNFGIVFQSYVLFPNLTAFENVAYGLRNRKMKKDEIRETVMCYLDMVNLKSASNRYPAQLSGGEQQRVALARAIAVKPDFLLLDEPLSALDAKVRVKLRQEIRRIQKELKLTTIMVTHDQEEAMTMADRIVVMDRAKLIQEGNSWEIYHHPANKFVADFIGAINFWNDGKGIQAIRPEYINVDRTMGESQAVLTNIEFRGNYCRLSAIAEALNKDGELLIDISAERVSDMNLQVGTPVYLSFPQKQVLHFEGGSIL
ncbi:MAG: ATP-binding cassette domain-containing protein [Schaedlerella sp.]|nr:ATP-binding cassette domain-containing protein [Schaedlerella sp.]